MRTIVIRLFINRELPIYNSILFFNNLIKNEFNKEVKDIELSILDMTSKNAKLKSKKAQYSKKGLEKIKLFIDNNNNNEKIKIGYQLSKPLKEVEYKAVDLDVAIVYSLTVNKSLSFYINYENNLNTNIVELISEIYLFFKKNNISINHGFSFIMENQKMPTFFASGILTENLTREEERITEKINSKSIREVLSVPFWLTCFDTDVLDIDVDEVVKLVGANNFINLSDSLKLFNLPYSISDFNFNKKEKIKDGLSLVINK